MKIRLLNCGNKKISAIKAVRAAADLDLRGAKDAVEQNETIEMSAEMYEQFKVNPSTVEACNSGFRWEVLYTGEVGTEVAKSLTKEEFYAENVGIYLDKVNTKRVGNGFEVVVTFTIGENQGNMELKAAILGGIIKAVTRTK